MSKRVLPLKDDDGHWYVIPFELRYDFFTMQSDGYKDEYKEFNAKFSQYLTGGDLNNVEFYSRPAPLTYTPAQVIEMVTKAWNKGVKAGFRNRSLLGNTDHASELPKLLTTLGLNQ